MSRLRMSICALAAAGAAWAGDPSGALPRQDVLRPTHQDALRLTHQDALRLTHQDALRLGAVNLLQARVAREVREQYRQLPQAELGAFDWNVSAAASNGRTEYGVQDFRASGLANLYFTDSSTTLEARSASMGLSKFNGLGGTVNLTLSSAYNAFATQWNSQTWPNGPAGVVSWATLNPYAGAATLSYTQPLLRGFGTAAAEARLHAAMEAARGADETFRLRMNDLLALVDRLYWDQVYAVQNLENKRTALRLAMSQLSEDEDRVKSGMLAPLELPQDKASVANWEKEVLGAEGMLDNARKALLEELYPEGDRPAALELVDRPEKGPAPLDVEEARRTALARRPELGEARYSLEARRTLEKAARNAVLPALDTQVAVLRDTTTHNDASAVWNDWTQSRYPGYYVGLSFSYPIGNRARKAQLSQARAATRGAEYQLRDAQTTVTLDLERSYTDLVTARKQVEAADKELVFRQETMDAEMTKLENGMSTSFFVLQRQEELDQARTADLQARVAAEKAQTDLRRAMGTLYEALD